jgi:hypothetical protein
VELKKATDTREPFRRPTISFLEPFPEGDTATQYMREFHVANNPALDFNRPMLQPAVTERGIFDMSITLTVADSIRSEAN